MSVGRGRSSWRTLPVQSDVNFLAARCIAISGEKFGASYLSKLRAELALEVKSSARATPTQTSVQASSESRGSRRATSTKLCIELALGVKVLFDLFVEVRVEATPHIDYSLSGVFPVSTTWERAPRQIRHGGVQVRRQRPFCRGRCVISAQGVSFRILLA